MDSERGEGVIWVNQDELERGIGLWGERGVLRLGMVSEGGEYGSKSPLTLQDIGGDGRLLVVRGGGVSLLFHSIHPLS